MRQLASGTCAPFWWHGYKSTGHYQILHNGTVCFLDTGEKKIAVSADHVYAQYLKDLNADVEIRAQFGGITVNPEKRIIARNPELDLVTFEVTELVAAAAGVGFHSVISWPPRPVEQDEVVLFGGHPGILREEKHVTAEMPFQWFAGRVTSVSPTNIALHLDLSNLHWPQGDESPFNPELGGMSGGPVFRFISGPVLERLELVGFIYEYQPGFELMLARPAQAVQGNGLLS